MSRAILRRTVTLCRPPTRYFVIRHLSAAAFVVALLTVAMPSPTLSANTLMSDGRLSLPQTADESDFGRVVALSGDLAVVGSPTDGGADIDGQGKFHWRAATAF